MVAPHAYRAGFSNKLNGRPTTFEAALETENFLKMGLSVPSAWNLCCKPGAWDLELQTGCLGPLSAHMLFILRRKLKFSLQRDAQNEEATRSAELQQVWLGSSLRRSFGSPPAPGTSSCKPGDYFEGCFVTVLIFCVLEGVKTKQRRNVFPLKTN